MERYLIEFNGLPGCGKSTLADVLGKFLKEKGHYIFTEKDVFLKGGIHHKWFQLIAVLLDPRYYTFNILVLKIGFDMMLKSKSLVSLSKAFKLIRYNRLIQRFNQNVDSGFIILSEGYIQFIASILDEVHYDDNKYMMRLIGRIINKNERYLIVDCEIKSSVSIDRILNRKSHPNSVDLLKHQDLLRFINRRDQNMNILRRCYGKSSAISIDMETEIQDNVNIIINSLKKMRSQL